MECLDLNSVKSASFLEIRTVLGFLEHKSLECDEGTGSGAQLRSRGLIVLKAKIGFQPPGDTGTVLIVEAFGF